MFRFRLQRVLELREKKEQARAVELSQAQTEADMARQKRDELADLRQASRREISSAQDATSKVGHLNHMGFVLAQLDQRLEQASEVVTSADDVVKGARVSLEDAARDRRVLDRLKEKHSDVHRQDEAHRDRLHMDEIALSRFGRARDIDTTQNTTSNAQTTAPDSNTDGGATRPSSNDGTRDS